MSLWTPGGEHPVDRDGSDAAASPSPGPGAPAPPTMTSDQEADAQQIAAEMAQVREQLAQVPAAVVIANHAMGCYELAAIHLSNQPPRLDEAQVAIDAFGALLTAVQGRLGPDESSLTDALAQIRMAFVQVKASHEGSAPVGAAAGGETAEDDGGG